MDFDEIFQSSVVSNEGLTLNDDDLLFLYKNLPTSNVSPTIEYIIFLIDCNLSMHFLYDKEKKVNTTPLTTILKVTENFLKSKIINGEKDHFGIVLFNTSITENEMNLEGVNNLLPIHPPNALTVKKIKEIYNNCNPKKNGDTYKKELNTNFPPNKDASKNYITNGLWITHTLLKDYDKKTYKRRVFLFTNNDDPLREDEQENNICLQRAKDMNESDICIDIFPMNYMDKFNLGNFYSLIITTNSDDDINSLGDNILTIEQCTDRLKEISTRVRKKQMNKRLLAKYPFYITKNTKIYINIYTSIKKATKERHISSTPFCKRNNILPKGAG